MIRIAILLLTLGSWTVAQAPADDPRGHAPAAASAYTPTEVQSLRLQVKQKDALLAKQALDAAQARFSQTLADLTAEADRVKAEQHWDKSVTFNMQDLTFSAPAAPAAKGKP